MKRILVITAIAAVSLLNAYAQRKAPVSDPEKNIYVGSADTSNPLNMYNEAVMDAFYEFYNNRQSFIARPMDDVPMLDVQDQTTGGQPSDVLTGTCDVRLLKSEILYDTVFYVWLEIKPDGKDYKYEMQSEICSVEDRTVYMSSDKDVVNMYVQEKFTMILSRLFKDPVEWQSVRFIDRTYKKNGDEVTEEYDIKLNTFTNALASSSLTQ
jgi:hypothetical protein